MRNTEKVHRSAASNLLVQFSLAELTLQLAVDPSKSRRSIPARTDGKSQRLIPTFSSCSPSPKLPIPGRRKILITSALPCVDNIPCLKEHRAENGTGKSDSVRLSSRF
jgi:hypothetical protein